MNKKEVKYICTEEYKKNNDELKIIFNKKYFDYIKRLEKGGCNFNDEAV